MTETPTDRHLTVLRAVQAANGFCDTIEDAEAAEDCVEHNWLVAEDHQGYAITLEGSTVVRENATARSLNGR